MSVFGYFSKRSIEKELPKALGMAVDLTIDRLKRQLAANGTSFIEIDGKHYRVTVTEEREAAG